MFFVYLLVHELSSTTAMLGVVFQLLSCTCMCHVHPCVLRESMCLGCTCFSICIHFLCQIMILGWQLVEAYSLIRTELLLIIPDRLDATSFCRLGACACPLSCAVAVTAATLPLQLHWRIAYVSTRCRCRHFLPSTVQQCLGGDAQVLN